MYRKIGKDKLPNPGQVHTNGNRLTITTQGLAADIITTQQLSHERIREMYLELYNRMYAAMTHLTHGKRGHFLLSFQPPLITEMPEKMQFKMRLDATLCVARAGKFAVPEFVYSQPTGSEVTGFQCGDCGFENFMDTTECTWCATRRALLLSEVEYNEFGYPTNL